MKKKKTFVPAAVTFGVIWFWLLFLVPSHGHLEHEKWAQMEDSTKRWFLEQRSPKTGAYCCSEHDGEEVQEDIRNGHYWIKGAILRENGSSTIYQNLKDIGLLKDIDKDGWVPVPDDVVIHAPNKFGQPVVWYFPNGEIRCYSPGAGI